MRSRIFLGTLFGAVGGFVAFVLQELFTHHSIGRDASFIFAQEVRRIGLLIGLPIGMAIGAVEGVAVGSPRRLAQGLALGAVIGSIGGLLGMVWGSVLFGLALFGKDQTQLEMSPQFLDFVHLILARGIGWMLLGALPGLAAGAATLSKRRALHGLIGGLIGGLLSGILFDPIAKVLTPLMAPAATSGGWYEAGGPSRAIGFTLMGLLIGLFVGLVEDLFKQGWVRVLAGKNEGKDYILSKPMTVLGRDERADVPLFGDPQLAPQHAAIRMEGGRHVLLDGGAPAGSVVNGQRVQQQLLRDGDMIQLGQVRLLFREKATASRIGRPAADAPKAAQSPSAVAMPSHLCPFCGAAKDAQGNCLCTVPGVSPGAGPAGPVTPGGYAGNGAYGGQPPYGAPPAAPPLSGAGGAAPPPMGAAGGGAGWPGGTASPQNWGAGGAAPAQSAIRNPPTGSGQAQSAIGTVLAALDGPYAGQAFPLAAANVTIGRAPDNGIPMVQDVTVSRHHAHIADEGGRHVLYDDGSSNGTFVNNVRVTIQPLAPGDIIQFGASRYRYE